MTASLRVRPLLLAAVLLVAVSAAPAAGQRPGPVASRGPHVLRLAGVTTPGAFAGATTAGTPTGTWTLDSEVHTGALVQESRRSTVTLLGGGLLGGAAGFFGGGLGGAAIACEEDDTSEGFCAIGGFVIGAAIGESALIPLGVHLANRRRENYGLALLASAAIAGAGLAVAIPQGEGAWLIPVPIAQLVSSIAIERGTERQTEPEDRSPP